MRVLYHGPYTDGLGADRWIWQSWKDGFEALQHPFHTLRTGEALEAKLDEVKPDLFFTFVNLLRLEDEHVCATIQAFRRRGGRVFLWIVWPPDPDTDARRVRVIAHEDVADVYFGEREPESMSAFGRDTGKAYQVIPNAASPRDHYPVPPSPKYQFDVVYLGANLPKKRWFVESVLNPLARRYRVGIFGPGWTLHDQILRATSKASKTVGAFRLARAIDQWRTSVPVDEERQLYSSAKICLNFHERAADGSQPHYIVNQRTFKIPACGGFQLCDDVPAIRRYFEEDELVMLPLIGRAWLEAIEYFLTHDEERRRIQTKGTARALRDHLSTNRVRRVEELMRR